MSRYLPLGACPGPWSLSCCVWIIFRKVFYFDAPWIWDCVSQLGLALKDEGKERVGLERREEAPGGSGGTSREARREVLGRY